ncbi:MAG: hypothetical protein ACLRWF_02875 [Ruthenibacterium sp.]
MTLSGQKSHHWTRPCPTGHTAGRTDAGQAKLTQELANLQASEQQLNQTVVSAQASFDAAEAKLADARQQYTDGMVELENGRRELADGEQAYEEGKAEAQAELDDAWEQILMQKAMCGKLNRASGFWETAMIM